MSHAHQLRQPHSGQDFYRNVCQECGIDFDDALNFQQHMITVHDRHMPHMCTICRRCYGSSTGLRHHLRLHYGKVFTCPVCDATFSQSSSMKRHLKSAHISNQCPNCQGVFKIGDDYNAHVLNCV
ncbi:zinc finger protein 987 [Elysia marginata]|uniref:Zinc finger protein 987 n=1 Tax=Elysia marginata TaxID=1093978 RepID=A0AAV4HMJ7_9GAST|nr:zinc finger protein 987 [Elysia marginata]